jgi:hypothetical protein
MKKFDFIVQATLLVAAFTLLFLGKNGLVFIAFIQFGMGFWQLISAAITTINKEQKNNFKKNVMLMYWSFVMIYFITLTLLIFWAHNDTVLISFFYSAWLIAIYYAVITFKIAFASTLKRKTFYDVVN